ncbi:WxL domain-containing protein [Lacticaseibacillus brantae]|uniref:WxL domain-containing protein n=1 Tax=Lacticaseibacillus brantae DSM 23927 TaxID=1423727 RepID=A0A0R2AWK5_9LACO|nr:WxL domain-containing protein [Lacticaseibacillus brantae]KRM71263.1 hypothetical protein FC34_GL001741 [Lacticaseibacillus brantae DSM 23927]
MKKNLLLSSAVLALTVLGSTTTVFAADDATYKTQGTITFTPGDDVTPPTNPIDPGNPIQPIDPVQPTGGPLSIDYASNFKFGTQKIETVDKTYFAALDQFKDATTGDTSETVNFVQVTDKRGSLAGWNLTTRQMDQFHTADGDVLTGAQLAIKTASVVSGTGDASNDAYQPGTVASTVTYTPDKAAQPGLIAEKGKGAGTWIYRFGDTKDAGSTAVALTVPGKTTKLAKLYTTNLEWTLADTPGNPTVTE